MIPKPKLVFASHNDYKTAEVKYILANKYEIVNLTDIGCFTEIEETGKTFAENAQLKSDFVAQHYNLACFADDSGLEIEALGNEPGIYSARYAGTGNDTDNINLVLSKMANETNRKARFKTVICLMMNKKHYFFEGVIEGMITNFPSGKNGFGYDPIFIPNGYDITFGYMATEQKNRISHRAIAMQKLITFLNAQV